MSDTRTRLVLTRIPDSWAWVRTDVPIRLLPLTAAYAIAYKASGRAGWLGLQAGDIPVQLWFGLVGVPVMFTDAFFQAGFYALNGPIEEAFFRGLVQGGLSIVWGAPIGFAVGTASYVLYHRLGRWTWEETFATALVGVPLGLAFWLLPGPASLLGVSLAHIAATCGFLGPGPYLLRKMRLV